MNLKLYAAGLFFSVSAATASAATVVDLIGDKDGLGLGLVNGDGFNYADVGAGDGDGTDVWRFGTQSFTHTYSLAGLGPITSASIELGHGGDGFNEPGRLLIDGVDVGLLTDGDNVGPDYNYYFVDTFDLLPYIGLLDGSDTVTVSLVAPGDGWALDYSELVLSDDAAPIPLPASLPLLAMGVLGFGIALRRKS